ncbi:Gfo/Idh/MocA family oxidoreductase [Sphingomonas sp.]|uniref:Gfo/Idh/MocA family protein n=1 Tax=Sphingomonas sp. TaxID=28214 RepID=UPI002E3458E6|nr:Gfo/Idh/MocA family oxidoreductase [Sphingomonas sp.]HEX4694666.1 Gfo/Idh/MocA family oxidoreductase [Sphingomonas sp.]
MTIRIAIVGYGKIARDEHVPAIAANPRFELAGVSTRSGDPGLGVPFDTEPAALFEALRGRLEAVAICTPPSVRHDIARHALEAGLAVLLEKPPAATLGEIEDLQHIAERANRPLFTAWHSQFAPGVAPAAGALRNETASRLRISWFEDVRKWHPGQEWIWAPGGFGVFDPGINALSIASRILPVPLFVRGAALTYPENRQAPIAAHIDFVGGSFAADFDWRHAEGESWTIEVDTASGRKLVLENGGHRLSIDGAEQSLPDQREYPALYEHFADLVAAGRSEVDREPLRIAADAFLVGRRDVTAPFV